MLRFIENGKGKRMGWQDKIIGLAEGYFSKGYLIWAIIILIALGAFAFFYMLANVLYPS